MNRVTQRSLSLALALAGASVARAQDTTFRGVSIVGKYDPTHDKIGIAVLPVTGAFGDSVHMIVQRDLDYGDRFNVINVSDADMAGLRGTGSAARLNYSVFNKLSAAAVVQITPVGTGLHVVLHDVARSAVLNVAEFSLPSPALGREWRLAVHRVSDEVERWVTGQRGISATRIAYLRGKSIRIVDGDGAGEITVPTDEDGITPSWSPDGSSLVYNTFGAVGSRLVLIDLSTGRSRTLATAPKNAQYITPEYSPDGKSIIFSRSGETGSDIYSVDVAGGTPRRLTAAQGTENTSPTASPDGRRIVFTSGRLGRPELYIMDSDGTNAQVLTNYDFSEQNYRSDADWSPDGRLIAYQERLSGRFQLRTIQTSGSTPKVLTSDGENEQPSWAPDARHLVFTSSRTGDKQLWVIDTESGRLRQLTKSAGSRLAAWSPRLGGAQ